MSTYYPRDLLEALNPADILLLRGLGLSKIVPRNIYEELDVSDKNKHVDSQIYDADFKP